MAAAGGGAALGLGADVERFAADLRSFLDDAMASAAMHVEPRDLTGLGESFERSLLREAGARGLLAVDVAAEHGGLGLDARHRAAFDLAAAEADAPLIDTAMTLAGFAVLRFGSAAQRARFLPLMARGEVVMCAAYTEQDAGSDLRGIRTTAEPDGDGFVLRGRKALVTGAHKAEWCLTIARTGEGDAMTMFLVDMRAAGLRVRRRETMNGWTLDEIVFDGVRIGPDAVLGQRDAAWRQLVAGLQAERSGLFYLGFARHVLDLVAEHVRATAAGTGRLADDPLVRDMVGELEVDFAAVLRVATDAVRVGGDPSPVQGSMAKVLATELLQRIAQAATEIAGHAGLVHAPLFAPAPAHAAAGGRFAWEYLERVHGTIGAGTSEVLRDAIAELGLGLPRTRRST